LTKSEVTNLEERIRQLDPGPSQTVLFVNAVSRLLPKKLGDQLIEFSQGERYAWHKLLRTFTDQELEALLTAVKQVAMNVSSTSDVFTFKGIPIQNAFTFELLMVKRSREYRKKLHFQDSVICFDG
jgi:hypothetical protein